jgi:hypothetical protein
VVTGRLGFERQCYLFLVLNPCANHLTSLRRWWWWEEAINIVSIKELNRLKVLIEYLDLEGSKKMLTDFHGFSVCCLLLIEQLKFGKMDSHRLLV